MNRPTILIVEDEAIVALDIRHRLSGLGYGIAAVVSSGEEAVEAALRLRPDVVLMDIMLEGEMDGIQAASAIIEQLDIPVVYLTAYTDEETLERVKVTQPCGFIIKPFEAREVHTAIEMACYKHASERRRRKDRKWLETTLNSVGEGIIATDETGCVNYLNAQAEVILAQNVDAVRHRPLAEVLALRDVEGQFVDLVQRVLGDNETVRSDSYILDVTGGGIPVELTACPVSEENGDSQGVVVAFRNISGRMDTLHRLRTTVAQLRQTVNATVQALVVTSEKRDPYTAGHQQRVSRLATALATSLGYDEDRQDGLRVAALLHDLGKIYIPAEILSKPARLTNMEFGLMQTHPEVGYDILREVPFPWPIADYVLQHHERLDGSGYPFALKGEAILPEARILAVADVVEAMSSHRPYRAALGLDAAFKEIAKGRARLYDPQVVDACMALFADGLFSFET